MEDKGLIRRGVAMLAVSFIPTALFAPIPIEPSRGWRWQDRELHFGSTQIGSLRPEPRPAGERSLASFLTSPVSSFASANHECISPPPTPDSSANKSTEAPCQSAGTRELASLTVEDVKALQRALLERGVYSGPIDGFIEEGTTAALLQVERQHCEARLQAIREGRLDEASWAELMRSP